MDRLRSILGILDTPNRIYRLREGEVDQTTYEYCSILTQVIFMPLGLKETLGPTWDLAQDPRFDDLESIFVERKDGMFGGDTGTGIYRQRDNGVFEGDMVSLGAIADIIGEGRNLIGMLRSRAIIEAASELYPDRIVRYKPDDFKSGLALVEPYTPEITTIMVNALKDVGKLNVTPDTDSVTNTADDTDILTDPVEVDAYLTNLYIEKFGLDKFHEIGVFAPWERKLIAGEADANTKYDPHKIQDWTEEAKWELIREEYPNYFSRKGEPNRDARNLYAMMNMDLLGLILDYAELPHVDEVVLLDDPGELYDPHRHESDTGRVSMEVENLERALNYRAEVRSVAYQFLKQMGVTDIPEMTNYERDTLIQVMFDPKYIGDLTAARVAVLNYITSLKITKVPVEQREEIQRAQAKEAAKKVMEGLKSGSIKPITRHTDDLAKDASTEAAQHELDKDLHNKMLLSNPSLLSAFLMLADVTDALDQVHRELDGVSPYLWEKAAAGEDLPGIDDPASGLSAVQVDNLNTAVALGKAKVVLTVIFDGKPDAPALSNDDIDMLVQQAQKYLVPPKTVERVEGVYPLPKLGDGSEPK